jgi:hypothetical protein
MTVFTTACHWFVSWARWIHSTPSNLISLRSFLILSSHLRFRHRMLFIHLRVSNSNSVCISRLSHAYYITRPSNPPWFNHPMKLDEECKFMELLIMRSLFQPFSDSKFWVIGSQNSLNNWFSDRVIWNKSRYGDSLCLLALADQLATKHVKSIGEQKLNFLSNFSCTSHVLTVFLKLHLS